MPERGQNCPDAASIGPILAWVWHIIVCLQGGWGTHFHQTTINIVVIFESLCWKCHGFPQPYGGFSIEIWPLKGAGILVCIASENLLELQMKFSVKALHLNLNHVNGDLVPVISQWLCQNVWQAVTWTWTIRTWMSHGVICICNPAYVTQNVLCKLD